MELLNACPNCDASDFQKVLIAKDWLVTQESFTIVSCINCGLNFTNPRPTEAEIGKYYQSDQYLSHASAPKGFVAFAYALVRKYALGQKLGILNTFNRGEKTLLDIGCATGNFLAHCKENGWDVSGTEPDDDAALIAKQKDLPVYKSIFEELPKSKYAIITMWHVLEHVHRLNESLARIKDLIRDDGHLIIAVPNRLSDDAGLYKENWAAYDVPRHLYHFSPATIESLLGKHGFSLIAKKPMYFDSFYVSIMSEKISNGSVLKGVYQGLVSNIKASKTGNYSSLIYIFKKTK